MRTRPARRYRNPTAPLETLATPEAILRGLFGGPPGRTPARIAAARAVARDVDDWRGAWERAYVDGLLPREWPEPPFQLVASRTGGTGADPPTPDAVAAVAADAPGVLAALALLREWSTRLGDRETGEVVEWDRLVVRVAATRRLMFTGRYAVTVAETDILSYLNVTTRQDGDDAAVEAARRRLLDAPPWARPVRSSAEHRRIMGAYDWRMQQASPRALRAVARAPNAFAPVTELYASGYTFEPVARPDASPAPVYFPVLVVPRLPR